MNWYDDVLAGATNTRFSSARVGAYRVTLARHNDGRFAIALCSPNDAFNRRKGQAIAFRRLNDTNSLFACEYSRRNDYSFKRASGGEQALDAAYFIVQGCPDKFPLAFQNALSVAMQRRDARDAVKQRQQEEDDAWQRYDSMHPQGV